MIIDRNKQSQFLKDEYRAESEVFKRTFQTQAISLLKDAEEMYVGKFITFRDGEMVMKFPNTRNLPRKGEHLFCMLLPNELQNYRNWGKMTYQDLYGERHKGTEAVCIWHMVTDDHRFSLVGFRNIAIDFAEIMQQAKGNILVFAPAQPPLDYISNLYRLVSNRKSPSVSYVLDSDFSPNVWTPILIKNKNVATFVEAELALSDVMILQGPPGTGKTYMISDLCSRLCSEGKSVLVTALTNRALMEVAEKDFLANILAEGKVQKTNMTIDEQRECPNLVAVKHIAPSPSTVVLSTYYITSGYAEELTSEQPFDVVIMDEASQALLAMFAATKKMGRKNLWVGDVNQLAPIVSLNEDRVRTSGYEVLVDGLGFLTSSSLYPVFQLTKAYRFGKRAAAYTGMFYHGTLESCSKEQQLVIPQFLRSALNQAGGPSLILTDLSVGDYKPEFAIQLVAFIVSCLLKHAPDIEVAVLSCMVRTVRALQKFLTMHVGTPKNLIVETIAKVQGLTTDTTVLLIPSVSYFRTLEPRLFNVATSRARQHTIIIADKNILNYGSMDVRVRDYLSQLQQDQMIYIPHSDNSSNSIIEEPIKKLEGI